MFQQVIVPLDGSELSERALGYATDIAQKYGAHLTLLRAYNGPDRSARMLATMSSDPVGTVDPRAVDVVNEAVQEEESEVRAYLGAVAQRLAADGLAADTHIADADPTNAILQEAHRRPDTLVVMTSHGRSGLQRLFFGSVAQEVVQRCHAPVLVIRVGAGVRTERGHDTSADLTIGAAVMGAGGKLGEVHRVIVDANLHRVTNLVVKHGFVFGDERVVPMEHVTRIEGGVVYLNLDERGLAGMDPFAEERYRVPDRDYAGPPVLRREHYVLDRVTAEGPLAALAADPPPVDLSVPPSEKLGAGETQRAALAAGMDVFDVNGAKIGEVGELSIGPGTGDPTRLTLRRGLLFKHDTELPLAWVQDLTDRGVALNVPKSQVEALDKGV